MGKTDIHPELVLSPTIPRPERLHHEVFILAIHDNPQSFLEALDNPPPPQAIEHSSTEDDDAYDLPYSVLMRVYLDTIFGDGQTMHLALRQSDSNATRAPANVSRAVTLDDLHAYLLRLVDGAQAPEDGAAA